MSSKLRIGIIGTGVGLRTHYPGFKKTDEIEFIGLVGSSIERTNEYVKRFEFKKVFKDYKELIQSDEIDFVCITTPNNFHLDEILLAIDSDKHILSEKPLASSLVEINTILNFQKKSTKLHLIDHQLRFNPYIIEVKNIIKQGYIGRPYFIRIHQQSTGYSDRNAKWNWSFDDQQGGGVRLAMASHLIDIINFWLDGKKPLFVKGSMDSVVEERNDNNNKLRKINTSSFFSSSISFENNLEVQFSATAAALGIPRFDFSVYGTEGELHFDLQNKLTGAFLNNRGKVENINVSGVKDEERENKVSIFSGSFVYFAEKIVEYFKEKDESILKNAARFEDAIYTQTLLDAIQKSNNEGVTIKLNEGYSINCSI